MERKEITLTANVKTSLNPATAWLLLIVFLLTLFSIPGIQLIGGISSPSVLQPMGFGPDPAMLLHHPFRFNRALLERAKTIEESLDHDSILTRLLLPHYQWIMTSAFNVGNEKAYCGQKGWIHYRPEFEYLTGAGFLEKNPKPLRAILDFHRELSGIPLIVLPLPSKMGVDPGTFADSLRGVAAPLQNPSYHAFCETLIANGIQVFDVTPILFGADSHTNQYLMTDTHWRPEAMESVAHVLAIYIQKHVNLPIHPPPGFLRSISEAENSGDLAVLLQLPPWQKLFARERVQITKVLRSDGTPWQSDPSADILLLGDSYANVYSQAGLGWGESAGFSEQLSYYLARPIDRLAINSGGADATRRQLSDDLQRGIDHLKGKRVVIYEFADRELSSGFWKAYPLDRQRDNTKQFSSYSESLGGFQVKGRIVSMSPMPDPGKTPYRDCIVSIRLRVTQPQEFFQTPSKKADVLIYAWAMQDGILTKAAGYRIGHMVEVKIRAWQEVAALYESYQRTELDDEDAIDLPVFWGEGIEAP